MFYRGRVELVKLPENKLKVLVEIKKKFTLNLSISEFVKNTANLPYIIAENMYDREYNRIISGSTISDYVKFIVEEEVHSASWTWWEGYKDGEYDSDEDEEEDEEDDDKEIMDPQNVVVLAEMLTELQESEENCGEAETGGGHNGEHKSEHKSECICVRKAVLDEVTKCVYYTQEYLLEHKEQYYDRGLLADDEEDDIGTLWLCGFVDILSEYQYVCELDWKTELEDFIYSVASLKGVLARGLSMDSQWSSEEEDISQWCKVLLEKWGRSDLCFAGIDMEGDSYVIFPYDTTKLPALKRCAQKAGFRIDLVENM